MEYYYQQIDEAYEAYDQDAELTLGQKVVKALEKLVDKDIKLMDEKNKEVDAEYIAKWLMKPKKGACYFGDPRWANQIKHARAIYARSKSHRSHAGGFLNFMRHHFGDELFLAMVTAAFGHKISAITLKALVKAKMFQIDHVIASVCDDPENFFLMFKTLNASFGFQSKENFKKKYTGGAWHAAVDFVNKALAMYRRYSYTH